jgi:hypothetical protein
MNRDRIRSRHLIKSDNMRPFNNAIGNGRNFDGYGNTHLGTDEARNPLTWIVGGLVFFMLLWAVVS